MANHTLCDWPFLAGRQDSNLRPPGPKPGALPGCATPRVAKPVAVLRLQRYYYLLSTANICLTFYDAQVNKYLFQYLYATFHLFFRMRCHQCHTH